MIDRLEELDSHDSWSVSSLKAMGTCGRQWFNKYKQQLLKAEETPPLALGSAAHKTIERIHKEDAWHPSDWARIWNDEWYSYSSRLDWKGSFRKSASEKLGFTMVDNYVREEENRGGKVLEIEYMFPDEIDEYRIGKYKIKGIIDQIRRLPNGEILIIDLKTSKLPPSELMLRADPQFTFYWQVVRQKYGQEPLLAWLHLRTGQMIYTTRTEHDIVVVEEMLKEANAKANQEMFARNIGYHCNYCVFNETCLGSLAKGE